MPFSTQPLATRCAPPAVLLTVFMAGTVQPQPAGPTAGSCFLLLDTKEGTLKRDPADVCTARLPPASTFKIPHALATAMRYSVVWYFQEIAKRLGMDREEFYLRRLRYGNADPSSGLTTFWLGGSLRISPEEQLTFLRRLYYDELPLSERTMQAVREILIQPAGVIVNATGPHSFDAPWPPGAVVSAKTGSTSFGAGRAVRWLVGRVERERRAWIFVSCVTGATDLDAMAAVDLAAAELRANNVL
jgi:beta-lactamase class D